jgi:hypothetical protein
MKSKKYIAIILMASKNVKIFKHPLGKDPWSPGEKSLKQVIFKTMLRNRCY